MTYRWYAHGTSIARPRGLKDSCVFNSSQHQCWFHACADMRSTSGAHHSRTRCHRPCATAPLYLCVAGRAIYINIYTSITSAALAAPCQTLARILRANNNWWNRQSVRRLQARWQRMPQSGQRMLHSALCARPPRFPTYPRPPRRLQRCVFGFLSQCPRGRRGHHCGVACGSRRASAQRPNGNGVTTPATVTSERCVAPSSRPSSCSRCLHRRSHQRHSKKPAGMHSMRTIWMCARSGEQAVGRCQLGVQSTPDEQFVERNNIIFNYA